MHSDDDNRSPGHRPIGAVLLIRNQEGDVLLVKPSYRHPPQCWQLPGGGTSPNEWVDDAARRECREELGIDVEPGELLIVDHVAPNPDSGAAEGVNFVFDGGVLSDADADRITLPPGELTDWQFVPPGDLGNYCTAAQHRRIAEALAALADPSLRGHRVDGKRVATVAEPRPMAPRGEK